MKKPRKAPKELFDRFREYFPYSTVDVLILNHDGAFLLTKRIISPYKNKWHIPGGIIHKGQTIEKAAREIIKKELNIEIKIFQFLGVYENPISIRHDISHCFLASIIKGELKCDFQSSKAKFFKLPPTNMIPFQRKIIQDARPFAKSLR